MAKIMNDEQRLAVLEGYDPKEHLIEVAKDRGKPVFYYPASWRFYELRLRHPYFTLESEIIHMDVEKNMVIVQAIGYDGPDYASSKLKGKALKQGKLTELDKVETKAKSRVVRDVGIGTEYALDLTADETDATHDAPGSSQDGQGTGHDVRRSVHMQKQKTGQDTHPSDTQTEAVSDCFVQIEQLLDEYQKLFPDWCEKTPRWKSAVIRKALDIPKEMALPKGESYTEDDVHRFGLYMVSKQQEAKRAKESAA